MIRSERLLNQLMLMEGLRLEAYKDAAGVWTIVSVAGLVSGGAGRQQAEHCTHGRAV